MIRDIAKLLGERGRMSLCELAIHYDSAPEALEPMLEILVRKGQVRKIDAPPGTRCPGCPACAAGGSPELTVYERC